MDFGTQHVGHCVLIVVVAVVVVVVMVMVVATVAAVVVFLSFPFMGSKIQRKKWKHSKSHQRKTKD